MAKLELEPVPWKPVNTHMAISYLRAVVTGAVIALVLCSQAFALTVYDVIQLSGKNYGDDDIIALLQATNSAFEIKAEDIPRLMELGVSETVIQAMLKAVPEQVDTNLAATSPSVPPGAAVSPAPIEPAPVSGIPANTATVFIAPSKTIAGGSLDFAPFREPGAGRHHHSAVNLAGVRLLILRDEGSFASVATRADAVVRRLERAASAGAGAFHPDHATGRDSVMFYGRNSYRPMMILKISHGDADAYQRRSGRAVSPALLAAYWSDLLSDYWSIAVNGATPTRLSDLHEGEALQALHEQWKTSRETETARLADAARLLPRQEQQHLLRLATTVPHDFLINGSHLVEQP